MALHNATLLCMHPFVIREQEASHQVNFISAAPGMATGAGPRAVTWLLKDLAQETPNSSMAAVRALRALHNALPTAGPQCGLRGPRAATSQRRRQAWHLDGARALLQRQHARFPEP